MGTADVLPKDGSFSTAPMGVRLGAPVDPHTTSAPQLRARVLALRGDVVADDRYALAS
jgi:hypothetical protein